jgi:sugar porter (SP) family MFS transporter
MPQPDVERPLTITSATRNNCHPKWWKDPGLRSLNIRLSGLVISAMSFGFDVALIGNLLANQRWFTDLHITNPNLIGTIIASNAMGSIVGVAPAPLISDWLGRRGASIFFCICVLGCSIGQAFVQTWGQYLAVRFVLGLFNVSLNVSSNLLIAEVAHPRQRAQVTSLWITFFSIGAISVAWTAYGTLNITSSWTWRLPVMVQAAWNTIQLPLLVFLCPESPRWLVMRQRGDEAKALLAKYHANGDMTDELVDLEYQEILATTQGEREKSKSDWLRLIESKASIRRLALVVFLGLVSQWCGTSIANYYLAPVLASVGVTSNRSQTALNGGLQIWSWLVSCAGALLSEKAGRKTLLLVSSGGMLIMFSVVTACSAVYSKTGNAASGQAVIAFLYLFTGCYCLGFTPIPPLYVAEISTPATRSKLVAIYWMSTAIATCFNQFVNPIALDAIGWKYYLIFIAILIGTITVISLFFPETKGMTLEEVAGIFDDEVARLNTQVVEAVKYKHGKGQEIGEDDAGFEEKTFPVEHVEAMK